MGTNTNVETHNLRRVISPDTPKIAREDRVNRPATAYACTCDAPMKGATSRRQARKLHKVHRMGAVAEAFYAFTEAARNVKIQFPIRIEPGA